MPLTMQKSPSGSGSGSHERRSFPRQPVSLAASIVHPSGMRLVTVRNFCVGGVFLAIGEGTHDQMGGVPPYQPKEQDLIQIRCKVPGEGDRQHQMTLKGRIARLESSGVGVAFVEPDLDALRILQAFANRSAAKSATVTSQSGGPYGGKTGAEVVALCNALAEEQLQPLADAFLTAATERLFEKTGETRDVTEQNACFDGLAIINRGKQEFRAGVLRHGRAQLGRIAPGKIGAEPVEMPDELSLDQLSLVEEDAFEDWLADSGIVDSIYKSQHEMQKALEQRLSVVLESEIDRANNPYGPAFFSQTLQEAVKDLDMRHAANLICYEAAKLVLGKRLRQFYESLNQLLIDHGVLPVLKQVYGRPRVNASAAPRPTAAPESAPGAESGDTGAAGAAGSGGAAAQPEALFVEDIPPPPGMGSGGGYAPDYPAGAATPGPGGQPSATAGARTAGHVGGHAPGGAPDIYQLVHELRALKQQVASGGGMHMPRGGGASRGMSGPASVTPLPQGGGGIPMGGAQAGGSGAVQSAPGGGAPVAYLSRDQVLDALSKVQGMPDGNRDYRTQVVSAVGGVAVDGAVQIAERESRIMDVSQEVFGNLLTDPQTPDPLRAQLRRLEMPVLKMAIVDESLYVDRSNLVREVVNKVAKLGLLVQEEEEAGQSSTEQALNYLTSLIAKDFDGTPVVFERVNTQLDLLLKAQDGKLAKNLQQVVSECESDSTLLQVEEQDAPPQDAGEDWEHWLRRANRIAEDDWLMFGLDDEHPQRLRVAWIAEHTGKYVFANVLGKKDRVVHVSQLAEMLRDGKIMVLDDAEEPAMDRAQYGVLQELHHQLLHDSTHDQLTGLINRRQFEKLLEHAVDDAHHNGKRHIMCFIDLDQFNVINNTCGYEGGDRLLVEMTEKLRAMAGETGLLARLAGDEFGLILENGSLDEAMEAIETLIDEMHDYRFVWEDKRMSVGLSVGLVSITPQCDPAPKLFESAESSCRVAKEMGGNRLQVYHAGHSRLSRRKETMKLATEIDRALDEKQLSLRCQRIEHIAGDRAPHFEVLLGLQTHEDSEHALTVQRFIQAAESFNRIPEIDRWVIKKTLRWMADNRSILDYIGGLSINLSGRSLSDDALVDFVFEQAKITGAPMNKVCFEITETAGVANFSDASDFIKRVKETGCSFSLDDFGSGMSSYVYLKNLPVDYLKIDGVFVRDMANNANDYAVVKSICEIGHFMGKEVVAEFVENDATLEMLADIGVDYGQGYGIQKPCPLDEITAYEYV